MTKYFEKLYRNHIAMRPEFAAAYDICDFSGTETSELELLADNTATATLFNCLFDCITMRNRSEQVAENICNMLRACIAVIEDGDPFVENSMQGWEVDFDTVIWLSSNRNEVVGLQPALVSVAVRRLVMLNLLLNNERSESLEMWEDWEFLTNYRVPTHVVDHLTTLFVAVHDSYVDKLWDKMVHAADVGLRCLIDAYSIMQSSLLHDIDKTDGASELHNPRIAGHHCLEVDYTLARFVEAANDIAATTEVKGYPCQVPPVNGIKQAVEYCLGVPKHELGSVPFVALFREPNFEALSRLGALHYDKPDATLEDVMKVIESCITSET
jgi:hypothetical protein